MVIFKYHTLRMSTFHITEKKSQRKNVTKGDIYGVRIKVNYTKITPRYVSAYVKGSAKAMLKSTRPPEILSQNFFRSEIIVFEKGMAESYLITS